MLIEKVIGNINDKQFKDKNVDYVDIKWHEAFKKLHKKTSQSGIEVGIKLDNDILTRGLRQGDVLAINEDSVIAVNIPKDKALVVKVDDSFVKKGINAGQIVNKLATATGGKGGGRPQYAQGAGKDKANLRTILSEVEKEIKQSV